MEKAAFLSHVGKNPNSTYNMAGRCFKDLKNQSMSYWKGDPEANITTNIE